MDKKKKILTLCLVHEHPRILLGMKKRGFGAGRWNGFGGKLMEGESIEDAARREMKEEAGIDIYALEEKGVIEFEFKGNPEILEVHVFKVTGYDGEPSESEEMRPQWFDVGEIPFKDMWKDDVYWMPLFLKGHSFKGRFLFDDKDEVLEHEVVVMQ